ncbi:hypothetical protein LK468_13930 [Mycobacteroides abscessus]|uniref:hypothetical protein n=1 Tax=Mycobacteroides abscessus TaxID=36809 RepID=UPI000927E0A6|nr:hypothetical protein [Mycobacteroides abscessus]UEA48428.1 hypothetical protein LK451_22295 [Mycobacteroides abscessus subsp. abscessus]UEA51591.1 hypothetical protein LK468_13930 [Mycobacteroides abscessus]SIH92539.1 Uncharacterised protein [Mycobacteroides abscessus subsp. bolletii]SLE08883.1 Uncharacterised protein [Mycobacteroides abscessus subsp. bolletii]SLE93334.1 Uncharacterised protein [Mycobacteroides abscessus subsp. bolletii]
MGSKVLNEADDPLFDSAQRRSAGVTVYVVDAQGVLNAGNPVYQAITALADTVNRVAQDLSLVVIARKRQRTEGAGQ